MDLWEMDRDTARKSDNDYIARLRRDSVAAILIVIPAVFVADKALQVVLTNGYSGVNRIALSISAVLLALFFVEILKTINVWEERYQSIKRALNRLSDQIENIDRAAGSPIQKGSKDRE